MMWRGIAIGVIISAPMGPVGILCVQRTLERGRRTGFFTGVGAAISDLVYCLLTGFGLSFIEDFLKSNQNVIQIVGSAVLIGFGIYLFRSNPTRKLRTPDEAKPSVKKNILSGFLFTFSNPLIIFLIIGLFARFNFLLPEIRFYHYVLGFMFIFAGALLWWWVVSFFVDKVRAHFNLRSMWLINKITGGIIMVFAVVGIITAIGGLTHAREASPRYLNFVRGFGEHGEAGMPLRLENNGADTLRRAVHIGASGPVTVNARIRAANNAARRRYPYYTPDGKRHSAVHPGWGLYVARGGERSEVSLRTDDNPYDPLRKASVLINGGAHADGLDAFDGWNAFRVETGGAETAVSGGNREYSFLSTLILSGAPDSIGVFLLPGAALEIDHVAIEPVYGAPADAGPVPEVFQALREHVLRSADRREGVWHILDMSLDDGMLAPGGDYSLLMAADSTGYALYYLEGAAVNGGAWRPGHVKAGLRKTRVPGVYDVTWLDASFRALPGAGKAQFDGDGRVLTVTFPGLMSSFRMVRE